MNSRAITPEDIEWIINILYEDQTLVQKRNMFGFVLGLSKSDLVEFDTQSDENSSGTLGFFRLALNSWISKSTSASTIDTLIGILISGNFHTTAEKIRQVLIETMGFGVPEGVEQSSPASSPYLWFDVPEDIHEFTGRIENIQEIHESIIGQNTDGVEHNLTVLAGVGGVGKTSLAIHYAKTFGHNNFYENVIWINSDSQHMTADSFTRLGRKLKLEGQPQRESTKSTSFSLSIYETVSEIYDSFQNRKTLIVFDNVESYTSVEPYIPVVTKKSLRPYFLITSRNRAEWEDLSDCVPGLKIHLIDLNVFKPEESIEFLKGFFNMPWTSKECECTQEICSTLQNLPLAINQASAYIKMRVNNLDALKLYLRLLLSKVGASSGSSSTADIYENAVYLSWAVIMETLKEQNPLTQTVIEIIAYFHSENIPIKVLYNIRKRGFWNRLLGGARGCVQKCEVDDALKLLSDFSLISLSESPQNIETDADSMSLISIHNVLQKIIRTQMQSEYGDAHFDWFVTNVINLMENPLRLTNCDHYEDLCLIHALSVGAYVTVSIRTRPFMKLITTKQENSVAEHILPLLVLFNEENYEELIESFERINKLFAIQKPVRELFTYEFVGYICKEILVDSSALPGDYDRIISQCRIFKSMLSSLKISFLNFDDPHDLLESCEDSLYKLYKLALVIDISEHLAPAYAGARTRARSELFSMVYMVLRIAYVRRRDYRYLGGINKNDYIMLDCLVETLNYKEILEYLIYLNTNIPLQEFYYSPDDNLLKLQGVLVKIQYHKDRPEIAKNVTSLQARIFVSFVAREKLFNAMKCAPSVIECQTNSNLNKPQNTLKTISKIGDVVQNFISIYSNNDDEFQSGRDVCLTLIDSIYKASDHPNSISIKDQLLEIALGMQSSINKIKV